MTTKEMRELDAWIAEHVMGWSYHEFGEALIPGWRKPEWKGASDWVTPDDLPKYTSCPAAAMDVLKKCAEECGIFQITLIGGRWFVESTGRNIRESDQTLELAICLFAKELFNKQTTTK